MKRRQRKSQPVSVIASVIVVAATMLAAIPAMARFLNRDLYLVIDAQNDSVSRMRAENERLSEQIQALRADENYQESAIRERLGLVKPDEKYYIFHYQ